MTLRLLTEHHLEFLSLKGGCTGSSDTTHVKMPHCWKTHITDNFCLSGAIHVVADFGVDHLEDMAERSEFPWLLSNIIDKTTNLPLAHGKVKHMIDWHGVKVLKINTFYLLLSHHVVSGSDIMLCNKINKPLVVYRFSVNVMTSIITLRKRWQNLVVFTPKMQ